MFSRSKTISRRALSTLPLALSVGIIACAGAADDTSSNGAVDTALLTKVDGHEGGDHANGKSVAMQLEITTEPATLVPGRAATWKLQVVDAAKGAAIKDFAVSHEKLMHLLVISSDMSWFNHIHPVHKGNREFTVTATLPREGTFKVYADVTPTGGSQLVAQSEVRAGTDAPAATSILPVVDTASPGGWLIFRTKSHPEGEPDATGGAEYQVALMPMPSTLVAGKDAMLHFQVRDAKGTPVTDLEPYLGAMGHAVLLSSDMTTMLDTHPMDSGMEGMDHAGSDSGDAPHDHAAKGAHAHGSSTTTPASQSPDVIFHTNFPSAGLYKGWGSFNTREGSSRRHSCSV